jgi:outer membrane protein
MNKYAPTITLLAVALAVLPTIGRADVPAPAGQPVAVQPAEQNMFGDKTEVTIGAGATYAARYPGAASWQLVPNPVLSVQRGILFADTLRGIGVQYQSASEFYVAQSFFYDLGRLDRNNSWRPGSDRLAGMGDVPGSATAHTLVAQPLTAWFLVSAETEMALRDTARRNRYRLGVEFTPLKNSVDTVTIDLDGWWGDGRYNQAWFGVTPRQSARTGFAVFAPGAGVYQQVPGVGWEHHLDQHWSSTLQLTATRYTGKVSDSPVVARRTSASATAAIAYTY